MKYYISILILLLFYTTGNAQITFNESALTGVEDILSVPYNQIATDLDNDGDLDIVSTSIVRLVWYENIDGQGTYGNQNEIGSNLSPSENFDVADIDGDGDIDILVGIDSSHLSWFENTDGLGTFVERIILAGSLSVYDSKAADIDDDGDLDIVFSSPGPTTIGWLENTDGQGSFGTTQTINTDLNENGTYVLSLDDLDGDGDIDVVAGSFNNRINWFENTNGLGSFGPETTISSFPEVDDVKSISTVDIDGDNDIDILATSRDNDRLVWYENLDGMANYGTQQIITETDGRPLIVDAADLDNDGDVDVLFSTNIENRIAWFENLDGLGTFGVLNIISLNADSNNHVTSGDINGDGDIDVISASIGNNTISWFENLDGQGTFGDENVVTKGTNNPTDVHAADLDGDGDLDIISTSNRDKKLAWYENLNGQGAYGVQQIISNEEDGAFTIDAGDIDGDGDMDIVVGAYHEDRVSWYENLDGFGTFGDPNDIGVFVNEVQTVRLGDIDLDGDLDILSAGKVGANFYWSENVDGLGTFGPPNDISASGTGGPYLEVADIDNDGDLDVLGGSAVGDEKGWYENLDGLGTYGPFQLITDSAISLIYAADVDGDGDQDVIARALGPIGFGWYENLDGQGSFATTAVPVGSTFLYPRHVKTGDLDNDGDLDIVFSTISNNIETVGYYENLDGLGNYSDHVVITDTYVDPQKIFLSDLNADGKLDVLVAYEDDHKIAWFQNDGDFNNQIFGSVRSDFNMNGCTASDPVVPNTMISTSDGVNTYGTFTLGNGFYSLRVPAGAYTTEITSELPNYYTASPGTHSSNFPGIDGTDMADFCLEATQTITDVSITMYPLGVARPGFEARYRIVYRNLGTTIVNGDVEIEFDNSKIEFLNANQSLSGQTSNTLTFDYVNLNPFEYKTIDLVFQVFAPPITEIGDSLEFTSTINPISGDATEEDNVFITNQTVVGSYDPNDIRVLEGEEIYASEVDDFLHYIIRFQNTGTASAINVAVENVLDPNLDWSSLQLESLSHSGVVEIVNGSELTFVFDNINLPDSISDEPNSHGHIAYKIKPKNTVQVGDAMANEAAIYFDFNLPILTNTVTTTVVENLGVDDVTSVEPLVILPNPTMGKIQIISKKPIVEVSVYNELGQKLIKSEKAQGLDEIDVSLLTTGIYFVRCTYQNKTSVIKKLIKK